MGVVNFTVERGNQPSAATARPAVVRTVTKQVTIPGPAPIGLQILAIAILLVLIGAAIFMAIEVSNAAVAVACGAVLLLAAFVLVVWVAAVLQLGLGPRQLLGLIKEFLSAIGDATNKTT